MYNLYGHIQLNDLMLVTFAPKKNAFKLAWWHVHVHCIRLYEFVILRPAMSHSMVVVEQIHNTFLMQLRITKMYIRWAHNIYIYNINILIWYIFYFLFVIYCHPCSEREHEIKYIKQ